MDYTTYVDDQGVERCDDCDDAAANCTCTCDGCGVSVHECACKD